MRSTATLLLALVFLSAAFSIERVFAGSSGTVTGVIHDAEGRAIPGVWIAREGHRDRVGGVPWWRSDANGRFEVDGLPEGKVTLLVVPGVASLHSPDLTRVVTSAGTADLTIVLEPGPEVTLRIDGYVAPTGDPRYARLTWQEPDGPRSVRYAPIRDDGWTRFVRLPEARTFEAFALAASGRPVRVGELPATAEERVVKPVEGKQIRGRVLVPGSDDIRRVDVVAEAYPRFQVGRAVVSADGSFVISDLPEGTYRVSAAFTSGAVSLPLLQEIRTGTTDAEFDLR